MSAEGNDGQREILERIAQFRREETEVPPSWEAKRELADSVRSLLDCICATDAEEADLRRAASEVRGMAQRFADKPRMANPPGVAEMALSGMETFHDRSPLVGRSNPLAPPLEMTPDPESGLVKGRGSFGNAYEGAPGCVHGGFLAAAFDELLGMATIFSGNPGMTGTLEVRYLKPTPIRTELRFEGRFDRVEGRRIYTSAELHAGDTRCAEATGIFVSIDRKKFDQLNEERRERFSSGDESVR